MFISNAHSMAQYTVRNGPGPDYQHESAFGKQVRRPATAHIAHPLRSCPRAVMSRDHQPMRVVHFVKPTHSPS